MHPDFSHQLANQRRAESDDRGILAMEDEVPPGPAELGNQGSDLGERVEPQVLPELVAWADQYSPVSDALRRAVPTSVHVELAAGEQA